MQQSKNNFLSSKDNQQNQQPQNSYIKHLLQTMKKLLSKKHQEYPKVQGQPNSKYELYSCLISELKKLEQPISDEEFLRGKSIAIPIIYLNLERQADRLEEQIKTRHFQWDQMLYHSMKAYLETSLNNSFNITKKSYIEFITFSSVLQQKCTGQTNSATHLKIKEKLKCKIMFIIYIFNFKHKRSFLLIKQKRFLNKSSLHFLFSHKSCNHFLYNLKIYLLLLLILRILLSTKLFFLIKQL
ncbi:unnamed protein product [Paramecium sonneborni]|uniref:Transmembrane protein n=1 Tax=Paramecium sonneborni TaxID=65129 RepID=A0A8S1L900_9CILI|nr:unnamed protein product [Paramecium sonneborni]